MLRVARRFLIIGCIFVVLGGVAPAAFADNPVDVNPQPYCTEGPQVCTDVDRTVVGDTTGVGADIWVPGNPEADIDAGGYIEKHCVEEHGVSTPEELDECVQEHLDIG